MSRKLTPKQQAFVKEYLVDLNATQAAVRAGYAEEYANDIGPENLTKPYIKAAIQEEMERRAERINVNQDWVVEKLVENVRRSMQVEPVRDRDGNETGEYVYKGGVANKALELLGKHMGMFTQQKHVKIEILQRIESMTAQRIAALLEKDDQELIQELMGGKDSVVGMLASGD